MDSLQRESVPKAFRHPEHDRAYGHPLRLAHGKHHGAFEAALDYGEQTFGNASISFQICAVVERLRQQTAGHRPYADDAMGTRRVRGLLHWEGIRADLCHFPNT